MSVPSRSPELKSFLLVALGACLWGCWCLFLRPAGLTGPQSAFLCLAVLSLPLPFVLRRAPWKDRRATLALVLHGVFDAANAALFFAAVQRGPVAIAVLTHYLAPLLIALAAPWLLGERRSSRALLGAPLTLVGLALLLGAPQAGGAAPTTALLGAGSAVFFMANVLAAKAAARAYSPLAITVLHAPVAALSLLLVFRGEALPPVLGPGVLWVAAGSLLCGLVGNTVFNMGLRRVPTTAASALTYLEPLTAALLGLVVFGEALGPLALVGSVLVLGCGAWVAAESRPRAASAPTPAPTAT